MTSNFDFLKTDFPTLYDHAIHAESLSDRAPRASCFYARYTLEQTVIWLYDNDPYLQIPYDTKLGALIHEQTFQDNLSPGIFPKIRQIQKLGNIAVHHAKPITAQTSRYIIEELFHVLYWVSRSYSPNRKNLGALHFDPGLIPQDNAIAPNDTSRAELQKLETQLSQSEEMQRIAAARNRQTETQLQQARAEIAALKAQNRTPSDPHDYNEAQTRSQFIDVQLLEMGWTLDHPDCLEYPVTGMPKSVSKSGRGSVDYVLWDDNGLPLAVIEAKRTRKDAKIGQQQAKLYADCLEQQFHQRPIIFYSNGYHTYIWDDCHYPPREIQGFLTKAELQHRIWRRSHQKALESIAVNAAIAGRTYQVEAIQRITETFTRKNRKALLVMATGTGKTRTVIALVDLLMRANWVKRVLFLADRKSLVRQARNAFNQHLPHATVINLMQEKDVQGANVVVSTYPTIMNQINQIEGSDRQFGPGYFDLVIIDEAHRSVYQKYRYIFDYFDALLVGLTATPRDEVNRDTYEIFSLEQGNPTYAYELKDAIQDGFLVPPKGIRVDLKLPSLGIKYRELSAAEQEEYEAKFSDPETGAHPPEINGKAINQWLFNDNTIDQALEILMEFGLRVDGGDRLGKTIIFSRNHDHAEKILTRFNANYPHHAGKMARLIDSHDPYAESLLEAFEQKDGDLAIAISVDMLDTGVDVPEVLNLVFFKPVYSRVKFNQMIGRGTRLCPDLLALGDDKTEFQIFDFCRNFEYFEQGVKEADPKPAESLATKLFKTRLALFEAIAPQSDLGEVREKLGDRLQTFIASMEPNNFIVRRHLEAVETFRHRERWQHLSDQDHRILTETLAHLPHSLPREKPETRRFDLLCLQIQLALQTQAANLIPLRDKVRDLLSNLETKTNIPMVQAQLPLIEDALQERWWEDVTVPLVETLRLRLRDLIQFVDRTETAIVHTNFQDELLDLSEATVPIAQTGFSPHQYRKKVEAYIRAHQNHVAIAKLRRNLSLTETDLDALETILFTTEGLESKERFTEVYSTQAQNLKQFIRSLVGLDRSAAKAAFSHYLSNQTLSANQIRFIEQIIDLLTQQGIMNPYQLYEPPFTDLHSDGLDGLFGDQDADAIVSIVSTFNESVDLNFGGASA
ncbi:DEAD/DEAH box helicase family protein [Spirulina major CS-329]|uniref:DEAD/DEAH box helicase family protein n=1 Tax=Spirulina TaxID=1154 RepID=UPI00232C29CD|nr:MULTISPECIES: DEAD/DEAH box helicase family protein [Spirulina]MDB9494422.1 DEAD/DEAH box helicase family protein [Spirulina subsalsa CS-330]MDB9502395.1 DEAD/DEAH box helicase family protein [Spirulina major CS-329]